MPRKPKGRGRINELIEEDADSIDTGSVVSFSSSARWEAGSDDGFDGPAEDAQYEQANDDGQEVVSQFHEKMQEAMDRVTDKSAMTRINALELLSKNFITKYMAPFMISRMMTLIDIIERTIKKGKGSEVGCGAQLAAIICVSLGVSNETDEIYALVGEKLKEIICDKSVSASVRARCAEALGIMAFVAGDKISNISGLMNSLYSVFSESFHKGNGTVPQLTSDAAALHASALNAWTLLATIQPSDQSLELAEKNLERISQLLDSSDLELRMTAGETIAVLHELARERDEDFQAKNADDLWDKLQLLATDGQKFRAKKERKCQRSTFRDVLKAVEDGQQPSISVRFGQERLDIDSWSRKRQYDAICSVLGPGLNAHLSENILLRDVFELGPPLKRDRIVQKKSKFQKNLDRGADKMARTKSRGKMRDKRVAVFED